MESFIFWKVTFGDLISILTLIVTVWIAYTVQTNLTKSRFIREHFIENTARIHDNYISFFNKLYNGTLTAKEIKDWLKSMSLRVKSLEAFIAGYYKISGGRLSELHAGFQQFITAEDEFNNQYNSDAVVFSSDVKAKLLKYQGDLSDGFTHRIIEINSAKERQRRKIRSFLDSMNEKQKKD